MTTSFMALHVASNAERLATPRMRTFEWFLARVAVHVYPQAAWPRKRFATRWADVAVLSLRESGLAGGVDVVMVLPRIRGILCWRGW